MTVSCQSSLIQMQLASFCILLTVENDISVNTTVILFLYSGNFNMIHRQKISNTSKHLCIYLVSRHGSRIISQYNV